MRITVLWIVLIGIYATTFAASYDNKREVIQEYKEEYVDENCWISTAGSNIYKNINTYRLTTAKNKSLKFECSYDLTENLFKGGFPDRYIKIENSKNNQVILYAKINNINESVQINSGSDELYVQAYHLSFGNFLYCTFYAIPKEDNDRDQSDIPAKEVEMDLNTNKRKKEMVKKTAPGGGIKRIHYKASPNAVLSYRCNYNLMENNSNDDDYDEVAEDGKEQFLLLKNSAGDIILDKEINDKDVSQTKMKNSKSNELYLEYYLHVGNHINCVFMAKSKKVGKSINGKGGKKTIRNKLVKNNNNKKKEENNDTFDTQPGI